MSTGRMLQACFAAGTKLRTPDGWKAIEEFAVGDVLLSRDEWDAGGAVEAKGVEEVFVRTGRVAGLHVGGRVIRTTLEHPFWCVGRGWVACGELKPGDVLVGSDGSPVAVEEVFDENQYQTVYNLRIADHHTYFVGSDEWGFDVWSHNASNSCILGNNMNTVGMKKPMKTGVSAHHIVAFNDKRANPAKAILREAGIHKNNAANGVWLPRGTKWKGAYQTATKSTAVAYAHSWIHTGKIVNGQKVGYFYYVNDRLVAAKQRVVLAHFGAKANPTPQLIKAALKSDPHFRAALKTEVAAELGTIRSQLLDSSFPI